MLKPVQHLWKVDLQVARQTIALLGLFIHQLASLLHKVLYVAPPPRRWDGCRNAGIADSPRPPPLPVCVLALQFRALSSRGLASTTHASDPPSLSPRRLRTEVPVHRSLPLTS